MANFTWTNAVGGDWSAASNWSIGGIAAPRPPGSGDTASLDDLANSYTVTVAAGSTVGGSIVGPFIEIDADPTALTGSPTLSISGSLTADLIYFTSAGGPATSVTVNPGGSLFAPVLLFSVGCPPDTDHFPGAGGRWSSRAGRLDGRRFCLGLQAP